MLKVKSLPNSLNKAICFVVVYVVFLAFLVGTTAGHGMLDIQTFLTSNSSHLNKSTADLISINENLSQGAIQGTNKSFVLKGIYAESFVYSSNIPLSRELQEYIFKCAKEQNLDYTLVLALIWRESRFMENAIGFNTNGTKDSGLMQINDVNRDWIRTNYGIVDLIDPKENVKAGTSLLGMFTNKHGEHYGILAYEWGEGGMKSKKTAGVTTSKLAEQLYQKQAEFDKLLYGEAL